MSLYRGGNKLLSGATNGWTVSGITTRQAGGNLQAINNPNFGMALKYTSPFFGRFDTKSGAGTQRMLELALKYQF